MTDARGPRLSGKHIVIMVVAVCSALVLMPVGVYAASIAKVRLVDGNSQRAVEVNGSGRLQTNVRGSVTAKIRPAGRAFSLTASSNQDLSQFFGSASKILITSITVANGDATGTASWIYRYTDDACSGYGSPAYWAYVVAAAGTTENVVYPTPLEITQKCALLHVGGDAVATVTGYRVP